jgi:hypothetical protein
MEMIDNPELHEDTLFMNFYWVMKLLDGIARKRHDWVDNIDGKKYIAMAFNSKIIGKMLEGKYKYILEMQRILKKIKLISWRY